MKIIHFSNEFPYDDKQKLFRELHSHSKDRNHPVLAHFLEEATRAVREEIRLLPSALKATIPPFESILNFVDFVELSKGPLNGSVDGVLLCIVELGSFIGYVSRGLDHSDHIACLPMLIVEHRYHEDSPHEFNVSNFALTGLGIGLLVASTVSMARTLSDLAIVGSQAVRQAFRLGVMVAEVSSNLQSYDASSPAESWAYVLADVSADEVQKELNLVQEHEVRGVTSTDLPTILTITI